MKNEVGVIVSVRPEGESLREVASFGLKVCQPCCWNPALYTDERAKALAGEARSARIAMTSLWAGWPGPAVWDFVKGPSTLGLVPRRYRRMRVKAMKEAGVFAHKAGIPAIVTHLGFIPEDPNDRLFGELVEAVRDIALGLKKKGMEFWFETGQETPVAMLRLIECVGTGNLGINLDPANLILYGKGNPVDALDVFGRHVRSIHAKDGMYPTEPMNLGHEVKVGQGRVRFPDFVQRLGEVGFKGAFIIEREISGEQQRKDIGDTVRYLRRLIARTKP